MTEIRRVLGRPEFPLVLSIIQVPVFHTYSVMTYFELKDEADSADIEGLLKSALFKLTPFRTSCEATPLKVSGKEEIFAGQAKRCILYTFNAADDLLCVDLVSSRSF